MKIFVPRDLGSLSPGQRGDRRTPFSRKQERESQREERGEKGVGGYEGAFAGTDSSIYLQIIAAECYRSSAFDRYSRTPFIDFRESGE